MGFFAITTNWIPEMILVGKTLCTWHVLSTESLQNYTKYSPCSSFHGDPRSPEIDFSSECKVMNRNNIQILITPWLFVNLNNRSWGLFWPRGNTTHHYFLIGWTYSFVFHNILTNTEDIWYELTLFSRYFKVDPQYVGVKKDPRTCLTWLFFGPVIRVHDIELVSYARLITDYMNPQETILGLG